jgi:ferrous iron transport protein B
VVAVRVALVGPPNAGKSTLFNTMTGARQRVASWPGTTVELAAGTLTRGDLRVDVADLPGTYTLTPYSEDERVTAEALRSDAPDVVVAVVPATALEQGLFLTLELLEQHPCAVVALTKLDAARARGDTVDPAALASRLSVDVVPLRPGDRADARQVVDAVAAAAAGHPHPPRCRTPGDEIARADARYSQVRDIATAAATASGRSTDRRTQLLDRLLLHPVAGYASLAAVVFGTFWLVFRVSAPLSVALQSAVTLVREAADVVLAAAGAPGWLRGLIGDGVLSGAGAVVSLVPYLAVFLAALAALDASGYLARATVLGDRLLGAAGLHGRSLFALVTAFGCNVPALTGTRGLDHRGDRLVTALVVPFVPCQARLGTVALLAGALFGAHAGPIVFGLVALSLAVVAAVALAYRHAPPLRATPSPLLLELPAYAVPRVRAMVWAAALGVVRFLRRLGTLMVVGSTLVWVLTAVPVGPPDRSLAAWLGGMVAHAAAPLGFDWRLVVALLAGFVAKEATLSTLGVLYGLGASTTATPALGDALRAALTPDVALAFLVVYVLYVPCLATVGQLRRELGAARWAVLAIAVNVAVALGLGIAVRGAALAVGLGS